MDARSLKSKSFYGSLLRQLFLTNLIPDSLSSELLERYMHTRSDLAEEDLLEFIELSLKELSDVCLVIDGIDEPPQSEQDQILDLLDRISHDTSSHLRVMVFCREEERAWNHLDSWSLIKIHSKTAGDDIKTYIKSSIRQKIDNGSLRVTDQSLELDITDALLSKSDGM